jgi:glycosyltransferase involved in cell wall biosynthesis
MRVGMMSYPMLFQREGGLQIQVRETIKALARTEPAMHVELVDAARVHLDEYDVIHLFSAINGNHRVVEAASEADVPVVLSPLISPGWNRAQGRRARVADQLLGRLTAWNVQSSYAQARSALQLAREVIALGEAERSAIASAFLIDPAKISVIPNGISAHFLDADPALFRKRCAIATPFVLMVGAINPYKNQLGLARALAPLALPVVLIGEARDGDQAYLEQVRRMSGVTWLGPLEHDDPLLASAFAAASVFALPSQGEVFPLTVLESLAAGTPVVMTAESALCLDSADFALKKVRWNDPSAQRRAVMDLICLPPARTAVRALVRPFTWDCVARQIAATYRKVLARPASLAVAACDLA